MKHYSQKKIARGSSTVNSSKEHNMRILLEARNISRVYNPHLRPGQRGCHHGFNAPVHRWESRLEQAMHEHAKKTDPGN
jgi:hypothetical protein